MKIRNPLSFYVEKIKNGEKFSLARYGDGELYCMWGRHGGNSNGCRYSPELRWALLESMKITDPDFYFGLQRVLPQDEERITKQYPEITWYDSEIFSEAVAGGELYPLIKALRRKRPVIIGNASIRPIMKILNAKDFIEVPPSNAYDIRGEILSQIEKSGTYLFSCGMAANALIAELHGKVDGYLLDLGHIWDPFVGNMSRCDLEGKTQEDINKNLYEKNKQG